VSLNTTASSYYYKIDQQFPVAGQDNDTQGFRSNFQNIYQAIYNTDLDLQTQKINTARLNATSDFAFTGTIKRAVILNSGFTAENIAPVNGTIDYSLGSYHKSAVTGDTTFEVTNWPPAGIYGSLRLEVAPVTSSTMIINFSAGSGTLIKDGNDIIPYTSVNNTPIFYDLWSSDNGVTVKVKQIANATTSSGDVVAGVAKVTQAVTNNTNTNYATTEFVHNILPKGVILMWSGSIATVPTGWALCNGDIVSGLTTPDLRNKFIVGADADVSSVAKSTVSGTALQTGGSADSVVVSHSHGVTDNGHTHFIANTTDAGGTTTTNISSSLTLNRANGAEYHLQGTSTAATVGPTSSSTTGITINSQGETGTGKNLPPFYALAYIIKVTGD
jgi:microcystin-dependent protein